ncbi:prolyl oligopeptidase family serine peptidase [Paucibacter sp. DJ1R-11]|uniref:S9 family peptidase n=1 Tax=Paucibacter sp. DJ1R-11 TaxID=2893556 RepID=UPI0021E3927A|nr:prolyl oligopeptidase family serine peptidase [Paucibacter sp. DJ1R-11]MCV2365209.1 prolyl oligopeptidase family serine peptidase [Paucibacter sp. DJ1R-11]
MPLLDELNPAPGLQRRQLLSAAAFLSLTLPVPGLAAEEAVGSVDAARFIRPAQMTGAALSPDGQRLALRTTGPHGRWMLSVLQLDTMKPTVVYSSDGADVGRFLWVNAERLVFDVQDRETPEGRLDAGPGLFAVDHDGGRFRQLVERQRVLARNGNDSQNLQAWNTFLLHGDTQRRGDEVLVVRPEAFSDKELGHFKLLRLNTVTGRSTEVASPLHAQSWWFDAAGNLRLLRTLEAPAAAAGERPPAPRGRYLWREVGSDAWRPIAEFNPITGEGDFRVRHLGADGKLYVSARRLGADKMACWLLDPATGQWSEAPLAEHAQFDIDAEVIARQDRVLGLRFNIDAEVTQWMDADMQALQAQVDKVLPRTANRLSVPWSGDAPWVLIEASADIQPTLYFLYNRQTRKYTRLGSERPDVEAKQMASMDLHRLKARDGLELPAWLTLPKGKSLADKPRLPLVVLIHGGPWVRGPAWVWDPYVQFLAARGYAVLQPQFRGTLGLGFKHERASWKQWGQAMQDDISDATRWAIEQGVADPARIALMGASYGGYSALMGLVREPALYRCAVAWVGVTDLNLLYSVSWSDTSDAIKQHGMPLLLGDPVKDAAMLRAQSPLSHAAAIRHPLLLAYGEKDRRVPLIHGEAFRKALQGAPGRAPDSLEWQVYADEGHGWRAPANDIDFWNRSARFLDRHLSASP